MGKVMDEVNLQDALDRIKSNRHADQTEGLKDLKHILEQNRQSSKLEALTDKGWHAIYEVVFRLVSLEKSSYVKASSVILKNKSVSRLASCAGVLRLAVELGVQKLRLKTVRALADHIVQTLPTVGEGFCEPLSFDYIKALRTTFEYQPHVEHLPKDEWEEVVKFCIEGIVTDHSPAENWRETKWSNTPLARTQSGSVSRSAVAESRGCSGSSARRGFSFAIVEDLILCLQQLTLAPNAPILDNAQSILASLISHLRYSGEVGRSHFAAFRVISSVLLRTSLNACALTAEAIQDIVPLVKSLWLAKDVALRDDMLIALVIGQAHIASVISQSESQTVVDELQSMVDVMHNEYSRRVERLQSQAEKSQLLLEDLRLCCRDGFGIDQFKLQKPTFQLSSTNMKAESQWMTLDIIAFTSAHLDTGKAELEEQHQQNFLGGPKKRRRLASNMGEFVRQITVPSIPARIAALQVIAFSFTHRAFPKEELQSIIDPLASCVSSENNLVSSWAFLALASAAIQRSSRAAELESQWLMVWQLASRGLTTISSCRAACHLMDVLITQHLVDYKTVADSVEGILDAIELSGPAALADSTLSFLTLILRLATSERPSRSDPALQRVLRWLFSKWTPSRLSEKARVSYASANAQPWDIMRLICTCLGLAWPFISISPGLPFGPIAQISFHCQQQRPLSDYLLQRERDCDFLKYSTDLQDKVPVLETSWSTPSPALESILLDSLTLEIRETKRSWLEVVSEHARSITPDTVRAVASLCFICVATLDLIGVHDAHRLEACRSTFIPLLRLFCDFFSRQDCEQKLLDAVLELSAVCLPNTDKLNLWDRNKLSVSCLAELSQSMSCALDSRRNNIGASLSHGLDDLMDLDSEFESQLSNPRSNSKAENFPRQEIYARNDATSLSASIAAYYHFLAAISDAMSDAGVQSSIPVVFVDRLVAMPTPELLACRHLLANILRSDYQLQTSSAEILVEHLAEHCLGAYRFERCEVSIRMCLDVVNALAPAWTDREQTRLREVCLDMYEWFVNTALAKGISSPSIQIGIAGLLRTLLKAEPSFAEHLSTPSVRTSLLQVLQFGEIPVKYYVAGHIQGLFGLFILSQHDLIFDDIHNNLPKDLDWTEGIAIRLLVYARLASAWHTLLRRGVYHIFETAGLVVTSVPHATYCVADISKTLKLESPRELFRLFCSQILYSWLDAQSLESIPFAIFGYANLKQLLRDVSEEVVGQIVMRKDEQKLVSLTKHVGLSVRTVLETYFAKAAAYSIARDVCSSGSQNSQQSKSEARLREQLGDEQFFALIERYLPRIVGYMLLKVEQAEQVERAFAKRPSFQLAATSFNRIKSISASDNPLPANQQPVFRAKYLLDELDRLCNRTSHELSTMWTPTLFVYVARMLLNAMHPALGSLYACDIIRKLRILVCLASTVAFEGYPLEMLLHSLRPFLTDSHCAVDTLGLVQFLLECGQSYLRSNPAFVVGWLVLTLTSLRSFFRAPQDSTTQESQYRATLSKAQAFHTWCGNYSKSYIQNLGTSAHKEAFLSFIHAALGIRGEGNSIRDTPESRLLLELLNDERRNRHVLSESCLDLAFKTLSQGFQYPLSSHDDVLGSDERAVTYASSVLKSVQRVPTSDAYLVWAARIIGRAHSCHGEVRGLLWKETSLQDLLCPGAGGPANMQSKSAIVNILCRLLSSEERTQVALAEMTLRYIGTRFTDADEESAFQQVLPSGVISALSWEGHRADVDDPGPKMAPLSGRAALQPAERELVGTWTRNIVLWLCQVAESDAILGGLPTIVSSIDGIAEEILPYALHLVILLESNKQQSVRQTVSEALTSWFQECDEATVPHVKHLVNAILYLRTQPLPRETTMFDRDMWLEIDYALAADAAVKCKMFKTALLFAELHESHAPRSSRRSSAPRPAETHVPNELLLAIFKNIDDPDSFYGVQDGASLATVRRRLDYESSGFKSLLMHSASLDSAIRCQEHAKEVDTGGLVNSLLMLNLNGLTQSLLTSQHTKTTSDEAGDSFLWTAQKLERWDIAVPLTSKSEVATTFRVLRALNNSSNIVTIRRELDCGFLDITRQLSNRNITGRALRPLLRTLSILADIDDIVTSQSLKELEEEWDRLQSRESWMATGQFDDVRHILSTREILFSSLSRNDRLRDSNRISPVEAESLQVRTLLRSSALYRMHDAPQEALAIVTHLSNMVKPCHDLGLRIGAVVTHEIAAVLWDQGEISSSFRMLQELRKSDNLDDSTFPLGRAGLLARLAHQSAESRWEKPEEIIDNYLNPAVDALNGTTEGKEAGQVYHEFAAFCDWQLSDPDGIEDFNRVEKLREQKKAEVTALENLAKMAKSAKEKDEASRDLGRAKRWYSLDDLEYQRLRTARNSFLEQSLNNYLLSLQASEDYSDDVLRFFTMWLDNAETAIADKAVSQHLENVPSRKFASLMNQLSSRLQNVGSTFQSRLRSLVIRICVDHPYHGLYHVFAGKMTRPGNDTLSQSRQIAAELLSNQLIKHPKIGSLYKRVYDTNNDYIKLAAAAKHQFKQFTKVQLKKLPEGAKVQQVIAQRQLPPPTMSLRIRDSRNYDNVPVILSFKPEITIMPGNSAPKVLTARMSDGTSPQFLLKHSGDDLRQDAIMEQVFEQVSELLKKDKTTRQRALLVRTYKVVPFSQTSGAIEFVPNTEPLSDFMMRGHPKYHPKDIKPEMARSKIHEYQQRAKEKRVHIFRQVCEKFNPVFKFFFLEHFKDPDDWLEKRLAYTRSTAAISILGHVLGLGDRHLHNLLIDVKSGEIVHIDLGVAFEAGRVLPVPEVVPFRLSRDIVDGMGITKTEGVFRRCCEFTLDALRKEKDSIMTLLNVLRYDPLYSWSISPLKAKKMQEEADEDEASAQAPPASESVRDASRQREDDAGEAQRALSVVEKKLSKTLSTSAAVNELIRQATDDRNLAVLFAGWQAYC